MASEKNCAGSVPLTDNMRITSDRNFRIVFIKGYSGYHFLLDDRFADDLELELDDELELEDDELLLELRLPEELRTDEELPDWDELPDEVLDVLCGVEIALVSEDEDDEPERGFGAGRLVVARAFGDTAAGDRRLPEEGVLTIGLTSGLVGRTRVVWKPGISLTGVCCLVSSASLGFSLRLIFEGIEAVLRSVTPEPVEPPPLATGILIVVCKSLTSRTAVLRLSFREAEDDDNDGLEVCRSAVSCSRPADSFLVEV